MNPWLGAERGHLSDWTTQQWVRRTGRRVDLADEAWLDGPAAPTTGIGERFFEELGLELGRAEGLLPSFEALRSPHFDPGAVDPRVVEFYERTATAWLRRRLPEREVLFAGLYSVGRPRLAGGPCVKTVFPLPNGYAAIFLVPSARPDGSLELVSPPGGFGEPGFYFVVRDGDRAWSRTVAAMTEHLHVYVEGSDVHADHALRLWGRPFLRLHYALLPV